jgi:hypothetical protein
MRLASRFGRINQIRRDRPLTHEELMQVVPSVFGKVSTCPVQTITATYRPLPCWRTCSVKDSSRSLPARPASDQSRRAHETYAAPASSGQITGQQVPEIILLNSHDGSSSYQMLPGYFRAICTNGLVCGQSFGEVRVPHREMSWRK